MTRPTISVIIPNYNHGHYLEARILSFIDQTYPPLEILIIDDGSTDNSVEVVNGLMDSSPIVKIVVNRENIGSLNSINNVLPNALGEYLYICAADDFVTNTFFEKCIEILEDNRCASMCLTEPGFYETSESEIEWTNKTMDLSRRATMVSPHEYKIMQKKSCFNFWSHSSILKKSTLLDCGGYDAKLGWYADWFVQNVMAFRCGFCYRPEVFTGLRVSDTSFSAPQRKGGEEERRILCHMLSLLNQPKYSDIRPHIVESNVLSIFGVELLRVIRSNVQFRGFLTGILERTILVNHLRKLVFSPFPPKIKRPIKRWLTYLINMLGRH